MILARGFEKLQCLTTCSEQCTKLFKANNDKLPLYKLLLSIHNWKVPAINSVDAIYSY